MHLLLKGTASRYAMYVSVWIHVYVCVSTFSLSLSFIFLVTVDFFIKNISHDTIHTFKNYFITVFLVFNFQFSVFSKNKLYPNGHCCSECRMMLQSPLLNFSNSFLLEEFWYIPSQHKVLDLCWDKWRVCFMVRIGMK